MSPAQPPKKAPAKAGVASAKKKVPIGSVPVPAGDSFDLTPSEHIWFSDEVSRISEIEPLLDLLDARDRELLRLGFGANIGYSHLKELGRFVDKAFDQEEWNTKEIRWYLVRAMAGFKLAMTLADSALEERQKTILNALTQTQKGATARWENDPTQVAKAAIKPEWERWYHDRSRYPKPKDFKAAMTAKYPDANYATLGNWMSEWGIPPIPSS